MNQDGSINASLDWEEWEPSKISFSNHLVAGCFAGLMEHLVMFPIDTLKTNIQCERCGSSTNFLQTWECAERIVKQEGIFRLWRGMNTVFLGCIPAHASYFCIYEYLKKLSHLFLDKNYESVTNAAIGGISAIGHDICMNPFDVIKQRMQLGYYSNIYHCVSTVLKYEGFRSFYVSLPTTMLMNVPFGCIMLSTNEYIRSILNPSGNYSLSSLMISGTASGAIASFITSPLDVIRTRLNTQQSAPCQVSHQSNKFRVNYTLTSPNDVAISIFRHEGLKGFFRGSLARVLTQAPSVAISWSAYETLKKLLSS